MVYSYLRGGSRFLLWICGSGEVGELLWRGDLEFYTGAVGFLIQGVRRVLFGIGTEAQVSYGFQQFYKKGDAKFREFK